MKLTLEKLQTECSNYREATALNLDCKRLSKIPEIGKCRGLQYLSLRFNQLTSIDELSHCPKLWIIDLLQNQISDISSLKAFQVLGSLTLSCNQLTLKSLEPLQSMHIITLDMSNPKIPRSDTISLLPHVWILNDIYITQHERSLLPYSPPPLKKLVLVSTGPSAEYIKKFQNSMTESQKFQHLIYELETVCELEWEVKNHANKKIKASKFPKFQICRWQDIKPASKLVLSCVIYLFLEGFYPCSLMKEIVAIVVTESYPENTPLVEAIELCELKPHYLLSFIMLLKGTADGNQLWRRVDVEYLIENFYNVQKRWADKKNSAVLEIGVNCLVNKERILENRQHLALFVLTVLLKFEIINQLLANKQKNSKSSMENLDALLEYARVDEETLMFNLQESKNPYEIPKEVQHSILSYSRSLQNLQISENNSMRYGNFLVKTKSSTKNFQQEDSSFISKFEELNTLKKNLSRNQTADKILDQRAHKEYLPPIIPSATFSVKSEDKKEVFSRQELKILRASEIFSTDSNDKPEFLLASSNFVKRKKQWQKIAQPPIVYSLSQQPSFKTIPCQRSEVLLIRPEPHLPKYYFEEVLKVSIQPSDDKERVIDFRIEFPTELTFLTRIDHQEPERIRTEDPPLTQSSVRVQTLGKEFANNKKWYPVPKRIRFVVDDNFVQNLKPCNFYEEHKDLLPTIPEKVYKKPSLMLQGKQPECTNVVKEIVKDQSHLIRVISRENTPWVNYQLKPKNKIKQDAFCVNYGELLKYESEKEIVTVKKTNTEKPKTRLSSSPSRICDDIYDYLSQCF